MKSFQHLTLLIVLIFTFTNCNLKNYRFVPPPPSQEEVNSLRIQDSISAHLKKIHNEYGSYNFGALTTNKPKEFVTLDSLYNQRTLLTAKKEKYENEYDNLLKGLNQAIEEQKKEINANRSYHSYQMDHIYTVKTEDMFTLREDEFHFLPNFKLEKTVNLLETPLSPKEKKLFDYFSLGYPLFETQDYNYNVEMDNIVYSRFNTALSLEKLNKAALVHTILYCVEYIRLNSSFDYEEIATELAEKKLLELYGDSFITVFQPIVELKEEDEITGYLLTGKNKKGNESITFTFDLNLVIVDINLN